mmetsp:Transcript_9031/g.21146  ORF Transcript_9031/g.21146 Transcript_9031/m.21146 type:complete len:238 (+) Transcript_9031:16-729(+)
MATFVDGWVSKRSSGFLGLRRASSGERALQWHRRWLVVVAGSHLALHESEVLPSALPGPASVPLSRVKRVEELPDAPRKDSPRYVFLVDFEDGTSWILRVKHEEERQRWLEALNRGSSKASRKASGSSRRGSETQAVAHRTQSNSSATPKSPVPNATCQGCSRPFFTASGHPLCIVCREPGAVRTWSGTVRSPTPKIQPVGAKKFHIKLVDEDEAARVMQRFWRQKHARHARRRRRL